MVEIPKFPQDLLTLKEISNTTGITSQHLARLARKYKFASIERGGIIFTTIEAVNDYLENDPKRKHDPWKKFRANRTS